MSSEDSLQELLEILSRIEDLNPQWELDSRGSPPDQYAELTYTSSDGISTSLNTMTYTYDDGTGYITASISVVKDSVCIYQKTSTTGLSESCEKYLRKYILNIANQIFLAAKETREHKKKQLFDEFMRGGSEGTTKCPRCRELIGGKDNFCRKCGFALVHYDPEGTSAITRRLEQEEPIFPKEGRPVERISEVDESLT